MVQIILPSKITLKVVMIAGKRASSAVDGKVRSIHGAWIPAVYAGMTIFEMDVM